jgi:hypothetical protein
LLLISSIKIDLFGWIGGFGAVVFVILTVLRKHHLKYSSIKI